MNRLILVFIFCGVALGSLAQKNNSLGFGMQTGSTWLGGMQLEFEHSNALNSKFAMTTRFTGGYISPSGGQQSIYLGAHRGFRLNLNQSFYLEQFFGFELMRSTYDSQYWFENDVHNLVYVGRDSRSFDYVPSVSGGIGYRFGKNELANNTLWMRPKVYWQLTTNLPSQPYFALQIGFSKRLTMK